MYLFDHVKRVARDRQVKPVTDKSTASKIFQGLVIGRRDLPTLKKVYGKQAGFSIVELTVVVAIVGALATIAIPHYQNFAKKAERLEAKVGLSGVATMMMVEQLKEDGVGTSNIKDLGFKIDGANYAYGFANHKTAGSASSNAYDKAFDSSSAIVPTAHAGNSTAWSNYSVLSNDADAFRPKIKCKDVDTPADGLSQNATCVAAGCTWSSGNKCTGGTNGMSTRKLDGLSISNGQFKIGAVRHLGNSSASSALLTEFDVLTIDHNKDIIITHDFITQ